jgi:hypothetical protein
MPFERPPAWRAKLTRHGGARPTALQDAADTVQPPGRGRAFNTALSIIYRTQFFARLRACLTLPEFG